MPDMSSALPLALAMAPLGGLLAFFTGRVVVLFPDYPPSDDPASPGPPPPTLPRSGQVVPWPPWSPLPWRLVLTGRGPGGETVRAPWPTVAAAAAAFAAVGFGAAHRSAAEIAALAFLALWGTLLSSIDLRVTRLPRLLVRPAYPIALALLGAAALTTPHGGTAFLHALGGMAALWGFYRLLRAIYPPGMGWGDVTLSGLIGLYLGWDGWTPVVSGTFLAFLAFSCVGLGLVLPGRASLKSHLPLGPFMVGGALAVLLFGDPIPLLLAA